MHPTLKEMEKDTRKPYWSFSQKIRHKIALPITKALLYTPITANQVTLFWIFLGALAAVITMKGTFISLLMGTSLFNFSFIFDAVDGQIARYKKRVSFTGYYLDKLGHLVGTPLFFGGVGIGVSHLRGENIYLFMGILIGVIHLFIEGINFNGFWTWNDTNKYPSKGIEALKISSAEFRVYHYSKKNRITLVFLELCKRSQFFNVLFFAAIFNLMHAALIFYLFLFATKFFYQLIQRVQILRNIDKQMEFDRQMHQEVMKR